MSTLIYLFSVFTERYLETVQQLNVVEMVFYFEGSLNVSMFREIFSKSQKDTATNAPWKDYFKMNENNYGKEIVIFVFQHLLCSFYLFVCY